MKLLYFLLTCLTLSLYTKGQGTITYIRFVAPSLKDNPAGEHAERRLSIYLPPGYGKSKKRYPVIYMLHGYEGNDSTYMDSFGKELDAAIASHRIRPVIMVLPNSDTEYKGSWYTNSSFTGNWADYIAKDIVQLTDQRYRTIKDRNSRGISGVSMGGHGALKLAMLYPDVFGSVYAMTPAVLNWSDGNNVGLDAFRQIAKATSKEEIFNDFSCRLMIDLGRTYSPNPNKPPFFADMPANYVNDSCIIDLAVKRKWDGNLPTRMIETHLAALKSMRAIKLDWGRNDKGRHVPVTCLEFSKTLEQFGIVHFAEEYLGGHGGNLGGKDGRLMNEVFPFFDNYLVFK